MAIPGRDPQDSCSAPFCQRLGLWLDIACARGHSANREVSGFYGRVLLENERRGTPVQKPASRVYLRHAVLLSPPQRVPGSCGEESLICNQAPTRTQGAAL